MKEKWLYTGTPQTTLTWLANFPFTPSILSYIYPFYPFKMSDPPLSLNKSAPTLSSRNFPQQKNILSTPKYPKYTLSTLYLHSEKNHTWAKFDPSPNPNERAPLKRVRDDQTKPISPNDQTKIIFSD